MRELLRWWRAPLWVAALATGSKSFVDNPILGSPRLNRAGLHLLRLKAAHRLGWRRRRALAQDVPREWREKFDRNGFVSVSDFLPRDAFERLRTAILEEQWECRAHGQGDTVTRRVPIGPDLLKRVPELAALLAEPRWKSLLAYVGTTRTPPLYYLQTIAGGVEDGPPDPQLELHSDTFHPSLKAWLFLTDVADDGRPLTYVAGSHLLTPQRLAWERTKSITVMAEGDRLSQRGSFRIDADDLPALKLPSPTRFCVPANTLVVIDTYGFHARANSDRPTLRVEIWAYSRRTPFFPLGPADLFAIGPLAARRAGWFAAILDMFDRLGLATQHWRKAGRKRPDDL